eukprot:GHVQ01042347.1.p1 GENE.GHVQ01042347.1~~GHVQ01042347.1.p1  ORF type:complete len:237 (+),score=12.64 GHVQ01042347.1:264-974(+)
MGGLFAHSGLSSYFDLRKYLPADDSYPARLQTIKQKFDIPCVDVGSTHAFTVYRKALRIIFDRLVKDGFVYAPLGVEAVREKLNPKGARGAFETQTMKELSAGLNEECISTWESDLRAASPSMCITTAMPKFERKEAKMGVRPLPRLIKYLPAKTRILEARYFGPFQDFCMDHANMPELAPPVAPLGTGRWISKAEKDIKDVVFIGNDVKAWDSRVSGPFLVAEMLEMERLAGIKE